MTICDQHGRIPAISGHLCQNYTYKIYDFLSSSAGRAEIPKCDQTFFFLSVTYNNVRHISTLYVLLMSVLRYNIEIEDQKRLYRTPPNDGKSSLMTKGTRYLNVCVCVCVCVCRGVDTNLDYFHSLHLRLDLLRIEASM